jgi:hypothetical protein
MVRSGNFDFQPRALRSAVRLPAYRHYTSPGLGFRLAKTY